MTHEQKYIGQAMIYFGDDPAYSIHLNELNQMKTTSPELEKLMHAYYQVTILNRDRGELRSEFIKIGGSPGSYDDFTEEFDDIVLPSGLKQAIRVENNRTRSLEVRELLLEVDEGRIDWDELASSVVGMERDNQQSMSLMEIMKSYDNREHRLYVPFGFSGLDIRTKGMCRKRVTILAARPGVGKTDFALAIARNVLHRGRNVFFASLEMDEYELYERMSNAVGKEGLKEYKGIMQVDSRGALSVPQISAAVNRGNYELVVVDHIGLLQYAGKERGQYERTTALSGQLRIAAKNSNASWLVLSQLSRGVPDEMTRPALSHLRDSGAIEQDAFMVAFLHELEKRDFTASNRKVEVGIAKNRGGAPTRKGFEFRMGLSQWEELE